MNPNDLRPLYGRRCRATVRCASCGGCHIRTGTLTPAKSRGDILIEGHILPVTDLVTIHDEQPAVLRGAWLTAGLPTWWLAWLLLAWLVLVAR